MSKFFYHQILADRFVLNLKKKTQGAIFSIDNLLLVIKSLDFCLALGQYPILNTTRVSALVPAQDTHSLKGSYLNRNYTVIPLLYKVDLQLISDFTLNLPQTLLCCTNLP